MSLDLTSLRKAVAALERSLEATGDDSRFREYAPALRETLRAGVIQHFEVAYEQCWKFLQRWLRENASPEDAGFPRTRKELFRMGARLGLVSDPLPWFGFGEARNQTSHAYDEAQAREVYDAARRFLPHARELLANLEERGD